MSKRSRFEQSLDKLPTNIILNFKKRKMTAKEVILYLLEENRRLAKSQGRGTNNRFFNNDELAHMELDLST